MSVLKIVLIRNSHQLIHSILPNFVDGISVEILALSLKQDVKVLQKTKSEPYELELTYLDYSIFYQNAQDMKNQFIGHCEYDGHTMNNLAQWHLAVGCLNIQEDVHACAISPPPLLLAVKLHRQRANCSQEIQNGSGLTSYNIFQYIYSVGVSLHVSMSNKDGK